MLFDILTDRYSSTGLTPTTIILVLLGCILARFAYVYLASESSVRRRPYRNIPIASSDPDEYAEKGREVLDRGVAEHNGCFQVNAGTEWQVIIPAQWADEMKSHPDLNFPEAHALELLPGYPGFEAFKVGIEEGPFIFEVTQRKLTPKLNTVRDGIVDETIACFEERFGESKEWHVRLFQADALDLSARVGTRISLGKRLARHADMIHVFKSYTHDSLAAVMKMKNYANALQPLMYRFTQESKTVQDHYRNAKRLITPEIERSQKAMEEGKNEEGDLTTWMIETAKGRKIDLVGAHMVLQVLGMGNMTELTVVCALQLCESPQSVQPLREEIISALREHGWSKMGLSSMKLLDSFMKEVHRLYAAQIAPMRRIAKKDITLSTGQTIPKGALVFFYDNGTLDPKVYSNPSKFDHTRHLRMREQPGQENKHKFVTTTANYMGFGHGVHACPGRFLADDQIKVALCILLLRYDVRLPKNPHTRPINYFQNMALVSEDIKIEVRRRKEEIDLKSLFKE